MICGASLTLQERITIRMTPEMIARIDAWIATQPGYVSRQDAVRRCVNVVLGPEQHSNDAPFLDQSPPLGHR